MTNKTLLTGLLMLFGISLYSQDASEIVRKADAKMRGENSSISTMTMKIIRPTWERTVSFKTWQKDTRYSLVLITAPQKEKGQTFLKREREMWNWNPTISRMIKLPPSMLSQGWMGSDFTNDDLLNQSSIVVDYTHKILGEEEIEKQLCHIIELIPLENAPVVWGKINMWISKEDYLQLKTEYYDEEMYLVKTELGHDIKMMDGRKLASRFELIPADKENHRTMVIMNEIKFNTPINDTYFSQQNMKRIR